MGHFTKINKYKYLYRKWASYLADAFWPRTQNSSTWARRKIKLEERTRLLRTFDPFKFIL